MLNLKLCALLFIFFVVFSEAQVTPSIATPPGVSGRIVNGNANVLDLGGNVIARIPLGTTVTVNCQFRGRSRNGYNVWDYVSAYQGVIWDGQWRAGNGQTGIVTRLCPL